MRRTAVLALALLAGQAVTTETAAQVRDEAPAPRPELEVSVWGGPAFPVGDLGRVTGTGFAVGMGIAYPLGSRFRLRTDVEFFSRPGAGIVGERPADVHERFITLGGDVELISRASPWGVAAQLGAGVSILSSDPVSVQGPARFVQLSEEKFAAYAGLEARHAVSSDVISFVRARGALSTAGRSVAVFRSVDPAVGRSGLFVSFPIEAGLTIAF
jgi:hypothetical protein